MNYLASPYSHPDAAVRELRFKQVCEAAAKLMTQGHLIFSPISHTHPIAVAGVLPTGWDFWHKYDLEMIGFCSELWVLTIEGWRQSKGVIAEIAIALQLSKPIKYISPADVFSRSECAIPMPLN